MNKLHVKYLIVGGGAAGAGAADAIRALDRQGEVLLVAQESSRPYRRGPLSGEALRERLPRAALFTHEPEWYVRNNVELRTGRRAAQLDVARRGVLLDDGQEVTFDKLLLATGVTPKHLTIPGKDLPGLHYLRTYEDLERLRNAIDKAKADGLKHLREDGGRGRAAVIGSGLLATEVAASLTALGVEVELLLKGDEPWARFAGHAAGTWVGRSLEKQGVAVRPVSAPARIDGDGRVQRVILPDGTAVACDFAVAAIGAVANRELLRGTPIAAERAILTDAHCRTSVDGIYAAGDCAAIFDPLFNKYRALEHFESSAATGALAGRNMAGATEAYDQVNHYSTEVFGAPVSVYGESRHVHHRLVRGAASADNGGASFVEIGLTGDDRVSQVVAVNYAGDETVLREMVRRRTNLAGKEEAVKDPAVALNSLLD
ncbi:MAG TPA: FAD-dependent oxidoreductase [Tepidisphaeraceae bacterium]|nr:FAD-dependent oxidoreductase [Tepidisphaeraceae bacterium]